MTTAIWVGAVSSNWANPRNWLRKSPPNADSDVVLPAPGRSAVVTASFGTVGSITTSVNLAFDSAGTNLVTTTFDEEGSSGSPTVAVDARAGAGGTDLEIGGALTIRGDLDIGNSRLSAPDEVAAASLANDGSIELTGGAVNQSLLDITSGLAGFGGAGKLTGAVSLSGASQIEFLRGRTSVALSASLFLDGRDALVADSSRRGSNSALNGLSSGSPATSASTTGRAFRPTARSR